MTANPWGGFPLVSKQPVKRLLLINTNSYAKPYPVPPLGLCQLASLLEDRYEVRLFDPLGEDGVEDALAAVVADFQPDYIGLGIRNIDDATMEGGDYFVEAIHTRFILPLRQLTTAILILGGSGFSLYPHPLMTLYQTDYGVVGEGEAALTALLAALDEGVSPLGIPGVVVAGADLASQGTMAPYNYATSTVFADIDRHLNFAPYRSRGAYPVQVKRGCSQNCLYCCYPRLEGHFYRMRPLTQVVNEIELVLTRLPGVTIEFVDSVFNDPPGFGEAICREIIARQLKGSFRTMGINPAHVSEALIPLMKEAGFAQIDTTPDSASPSMLYNLKKNFTLPQLERAAERIRRHGMPTMWFFLLGGPGESAGTIAETFTFVDKFVSPEDMVLIFEGLRIYPGTDLHTTALEQGVVDPDDNLLLPRFFVEPTLGSLQLKKLVTEGCQSRPNCLRSTDSKPPPKLLEQAQQVRRELQLTEPMFRTLLRLSRQGSMVAENNR